MTNTANLSNEAKSALINARGGSRRGATLPASTPFGVRVELNTAGVTGVRDGLTDAGATARAKLINAMMDAF